DEGAPAPCRRRARDVDVHDCLLGVFGRESALSLCCTSMAALSMSDPAARLSGVRFSVTLGAAGDGRDPAGLAVLAALAEKSGWDAMFLEGYLVYQGTDLPTYGPGVSLAAMASATTRIRLGTTVTPLPRRRPWELAAQAVAVDHLSHGRLVLGVGA